MRNNGPFRNVSSRRETVFERQNQWPDTPVIVLLWSDGDWQTGGRHRTRGTDRIGEVVNADSMQVYCGMDIIGTGQTYSGPNLKRRFPPVDIATPDHQVSVADWKRGAKKPSERSPRRIASLIVCGGAWASICVHCWTTGPWRQRSRPQINRRTRASYHAFRRALVACKTPGSGTRSPPRASIPTMRSESCGLSGGLPLNRHPISLFKNVIATHGGTPGLALRPGSAAPRVKCPVTMHEDATPKASSLVEEVQNLT